MASIRQFADELACQLHGFYQEGEGAFRINWKRL